MVRKCATLSEGRESEWGYATGIGKQGSRPRCAVVDAGGGCDFAHPEPTASATMIIRARGCACKPESRVTRAVHSRDSQIAKPCFQYTINSGGQGVGMCKNRVKVSARFTDFCREQVYNKIVTSSTEARNNSGIIHKRSVNGFY